MKNIKSLLHIFLWSLLSLGIITGLTLAQENSDRKSKQGSFPQLEKRKSAFEIPKGYMLFEEDILLPEDYFENTESVFNTNLWPNGIVPYEFDANVNQANQNTMLNAMTEWENDANIDFVLRTNETNYIHIQNDNANYSTGVGIQGGMQTIGIFNWNFRFIMAHELAHALGIWHEQSRSDRDDYVQINWANIEAGKEHNFQMITSADVYPKQDYALPDTLTYDFDSMMHYGQFAFSNNGLPTITVLPPNQAWQNRIGQRNHISFIDSLTMSFLYPENDWYFVDNTNTGSQNGSFLESYTEFTTAINSSGVPSNSTLWIQPNNYSAIGVYNKAITLRAPLGNVVLGN